MSVLTVINRSKAVKSYLNVLIHFNGEHPDFLTIRGCGGSTIQ